MDAAVPKVNFEPLVSNDLLEPKLVYSRCKPQKVQQVMPTTYKNVQTMPERWFTSIYTGALTSRFELGSYRAGFFLRGSEICAGIRPNRL